MVALAVCTAILSSPASAAPADQKVSSIIEKWSAGSNRLGADARARLYSKNGFGSAPPRHKDKEGVAAYFTALPRLKSPTLRASRCLPLLPISTRTNRSAGETYLRVLPRGSPRWEDDLGHRDKDNAKLKSASWTLRFRNGWFTT